MLADYAYDPLSRRASVTRGNGTVSTYAYDAASRLTGLTQDLAGGAANDQTYGFNYTAASQIAQRTASNDNYNWFTQNVSRSYARNGLNQYTNVSGINFTYDARGNLMSDGSRTFAYDLENRLLSVSGSSSLALAYDPLGRLHSTASNGVSTELLYDGDRLVGEYNASGVLLRRYVHGMLVRGNETDAFQDEPILWYEGAGLTDRRWLIPDHQNSIIATNDNAGATMIQSYGPYGEPLSWSGSRFRYTGQMALPDVQLYHYRARVYDPIIGRFLQTDPIGYEESYNLYQYAANDPLNNTDPMGQITLNLGFEFEIVTPDHRGGERNQGGAGVFINLHEGQLTVGAYTSEGNRGGSDIGVAGTIGLTGGDVRNDFAGRATTAERDTSSYSFEGGRTESGRMTGSLEFGTPLPGASAGESNVVVTNEVNVNQAVGRFLNDIANIGDQMRDAGGVPRIPDPEFR